MRFLRTKDVCEMLGVHRMTLWKWRREGTFPKGQLIGPRTVGWLESEVEEWMKSRPPAGGRVTVAVSPSP